MKLTVDRSDLLRALSCVRGAVQACNVPILGNVLITAETKLQVSATDLVMVVTVTTGADVTTPGSLAVPLGPLYELVRRMPDAARVSLELTDKRLTVRAGRMRAGLPTLPGADFPAFTEQVFSHFFTTPGLGAAIAATIHAVSADDSRVALCGAYLHADGLVATDGHRLVQHDTPMGGPGVIVSRRTLAELERLVKDDEVTIEVCPTLIRFTFGDTVVTSKLIDGTFPDYGRVVPLGNDRQVECDRLELAKAVGRVGAVSEKGMALRFEVTGSCVRVSVVDASAGTDATEEVDCEYDGEPVTIGLNSRYFLEALEHTVGERCTVAIKDDRTPVLVRGTDETLQVVMVMRVDDGKENQTKAYC